MGHYASEMDPNWSVSIDRANRVLQIKERLRHKRLGDFSVEDLPHLYILFTLQSEGSQQVALRHLQAKFGGD